MPLTWVLVRAPADQAPVQNVFVDSDAHHPVGMTGTPFRIENGVHTFSLRSGITVIAEAMEDCPEASRTAPFRVELIPTAIAVLNPPAPPRLKKTAKKARKKTARKKTAARKKSSAGKKAAPKRKAAAKRKTAPKRKTAAKRKAPKKAAAKTKTKRPARGRARRSS
jgi:hypothetical protein